ncbi:MAG: hypothetical protein BGO78_04370 [Chloroflexi bacterium 44-23]|nr:MAG: hypothetical protein BGO78_04370 [Chloroflexi bacterium 44-23]
MPTDTNTITPKSIFKRMIPAFLLAFLVLIVIGFLGDLRMITETIRDFKWSIFPAVILFTLFNYGVRFVKWHYYLGQIGISDFSIGRSLRLFIAGFPLAMTPGKAGEVLKGVWLNQQTDIPIARGISVVLAERISDGVAVLLLSTLGVIIYPQYWPVFLFVLLLLLGIIVVSQIRPLAEWLLNYSTRIPIVRRFSDGLRQFYEGSFALFRPGVTLVAVGMGMLSWLGEGIGFYIILINLGIPAGRESLATAVFILSFSTIVGAISALPGGLFAAEASIAGMLAVVIGMSTSQASVAALLIRLATLWFGVSLGLIVWLFSLEYFGFKKPKGVTNEI